MTQSENAGAAAPIGVDRAVRKVAAQLMYACSLACLLAALSIVLLMWIAYQVSGSQDWPTQYWFAVVPLLLVALTLFGAGFRFEAPPPPPNGRA